MAIHENYKDRFKRNITTLESDACAKTRVNSSVNVSLSNKISIQGLKNNLNNFNLKPTRDSAEGLQNV